MSRADTGTKNAALEAIARNTEYLRSVSDALAGESSALDVAPLDADGEAILFLQLATTLIRRLRPGALVVADTFCFGAKVHHQTVHEDRFEQGSNVVDLGSIPAVENGTSLRTDDEPLTRARPCAEPVSLPALCSSGSPRSSGLGP